MGKCRIRLLPSAKWKNNCRRDTFNKAIGEKGFLPTRSGTSLKSSPPGFAEVGRISPGSGKGYLSWRVSTDRQRLLGNNFPPQNPVMKSKCQFDVFI